MAKIIKQIQTELENPPALFLLVHSPGSGPFCGLHPCYLGVAQHAQCTEVVDPALASALHSSSDEDDEITHDMWYGG